MENIDFLGGRVFNRIILDEAETIEGDHSDNPFWMRLRGLIRWAHIASVPPIPNLGDPKKKKKNLSNSSISSALCGLNHFTRERYLIFYSIQINAS